MSMPYRGTTLRSLTLETNQASRKNFHWSRRPSGTTRGRKKFKVSVAGPPRLVFYGGEGVRVRDMVLSKCSQENSSSSKQLKASSFIVFALRHVLFNTHFCIRLITYIFCTGHLLQNSLTEILICHWTASNVVGPECSNLVEDASNVFACPGVDDRAVTYTLPADLISAIIKRFSFEGNWILDLTRSKGTFTTYTVRTKNLVTCQHTVNRQPRISNKRN